MDPRKVQLSVFQKAICFIRAFNQEIPIPLLMSIIVGLATGVFTFFNISSTSLFNIWFLAIFAGVVGFLIMVGLFVFWIEIIVPSFARIGDHYEMNTLDMKKKVLDNVIEDEILK